MAQTTTAKTEGSSFPAKVNINTGGKGGTVVLIAGVLFTGYLYFTRRLPGVLQAVVSPGKMTLATASTNGTTTPNVGTPPINPSGSGGYGPAPYNVGFVNVTIAYPPNSGLPAETIKVDPKYCHVTVYSHVLSRTANIIWAQAIADSACRGLN